MELLTQKFKFYGDGGKLFVLMLVNTLLTFVTVGFYYPWYKAALLKYYYSETEFAENRFEFHGTGKEMFIGFIKAIAIVIVLYALIFLGALSKNPIIMFLTFGIYFVGLIFLIPLAIHGTLRYRSSRSSWKSIRFGYRGSFSKLTGTYLLGIFLTMITLGIYGSWYTVSIRKYVISNLRLGNVQFDYRGKGEDLFIIHLTGILLTIVTLGIYSFWYVRNVYRFHVNNSYLIQDGKECQFSTDISAGKVFSMLVVSTLLIIVTLGFGTSWAIVRNLRIMYGSAMLNGEFNADTIAQTEGDFGDATGDDLAGMLDISLPI